ncbi:MAG: FTR1 family protein [Herpetosiphonaceae bacterium]|nr:FTR1 family protein [Herpetosiphonaceae bacterium]
MRIRYLVVGLLLLLGIVAQSSQVVAAPRFADPKADMRALDAKLVPVQQALAASDWARARSAYAAFDSGWLSAEDGVRASSMTSYRAIEQAMGDLKFALKQEPVNVAKASAALNALQQADQEFLSAGTTASAPSSDAPTLASILPQLDQAQAALKSGNLTVAQAAINAFRTAWPDAEGVVKIKDAAAYARTEDLLPVAAHALADGKPQVAQQALTELQTTLTPFATAKLTYTVFDAASILLREGLEALLVIAALLAFLTKSGNADKRRWIWGGGILGILCSVATAVAIYGLFRTFVTGSNRELIEGVTGLTAAGLLFYVSYWLHSKTNIGGWQKYLKDRTSDALARSSLISLGTLAFLSVFREGAETALFYIGIAPSIALHDLLLGLSIGMLTLMVLGVLIIGLGVRIPLSQFFRVASLLIWYLGFKFIGTGLHALQVARVIPATGSSLLPSLPSLGLYPTWETTVTQLVLIVLACVIVITMRVTHSTARKHQPAHA